MKPSSLQKASRRNEKVKKHLGNFRQGFEKVAELLTQAHEYIDELETDLAQSRQQNKKLQAEIRKLRGGTPHDVPRRRTGSEDIGQLFRTRSLDDNLRKTSPVNGKRSKSFKDVFKQKSKFGSSSGAAGSGGSSGLVHERLRPASSDSREGSDDDDTDAASPARSVTGDDDMETPRGQYPDSAASSVFNTPQTNRSRKSRPDTAGGDSSGDESGGEGAGGWLGPGGGQSSAGATGASRGGSGSFGNDIVQMLSQRIYTDPEIRKAAGFSQELVVPPMEDSPFYRELVKSFGTSVHAVAKYLKKLSKCANSFAADARRLMESWKELGYVLRNSIGSKHIDKRQDYFFQNQDKMFNAHALLGNLFQDAGKNIQQFFDDVQKHFVMPIEAFVETDSKEVKLLKRRLDEREEKYMKHLRKFLDNKVRPSHKQKAESNESSNLKNKREYEIARFQYIYRLNIISARKDIDVLSGVGAAGRAFVNLGLVDNSHSARELMEQISAMESTVEAKRDALASDAALWLEKKKLLHSELSKGSFPRVTSDPPMAASATPTASGGSSGSSAGVAGGSARDRVDLCTPASLKGLKVYADPPILPGVEQQGYLYKKGHNVVTPWQRRWFYIANGKLWYYRDHEPISVGTKDAYAGKHAVSSLAASKGGPIKGTSGKSSSSRGANGRSGSGNSSQSAAIKVCDIMLCTVRECEGDKDFQLSFEIIAPGSRSYVLQAESIEELQQWTSAIRRCIENELINKGGSSSSNDLLQRLTSAGNDVGGRANNDGGASPSSAGDRSRSRSGGSPSLGGISPEVSELLEMNAECVDCRAPDPDWASINLGVVVCIACSGVHRSMGSHISHVRSLTLDRGVWTTPLVGIVRRIGNTRSREIFERTASPDQVKRRALASSKARSSSANSLVDAEDEEELAIEEWVRAKYENRAYIGQPPNDYVANEALMRAAKDDDLVGILQAICFGANVNHTDHVGRSPVMAAAALGHESAVALLYYNGATLDTQDGAGDRIIDIAATGEVLHLRYSRFLAWLLIPPLHN
eukprot:INCI9595.2.p1 GENE.INCI9595.2~~INCI9595.2.p1  ORF type:complete len:1036 (+),score=226.57 INCI9595.2:286-3393(+)